MAALEISLRAHFEVRQPVMVEKHVHWHSAAGIKVLHEVRTLAEGIGRCIARVQSGKAERGQLVQRLFKKSCQRCVSLMLRLNGSDHRVGAAVKQLSRGKAVAAALNFRI